MAFLFAYHYILVAREECLPTVARQTNQGSFDPIFVLSAILWWEYLFIDGNSVNVSMLFLFKINDSDKFAPYDAPPTLFLSPPQILRVDLFIFCLGCPPLKRKFGLHSSKSRPNKYHCNALWGKCEMKT